MKTSREVLLQYHRSAEAKLDRIRESVVASLETQPSREVESRRRASFLRSFILPLRWHLAGLSVAWVVVALLNIDRPSDAPTSQQVQAPPRHLLTELQENRRRIFELVESPLAEPAAIPPTFIPRRRSGIESPCAVV